MFSHQAAGIDDARSSRSWGSQIRLYLFLQADIMDSFLRLLNLFYLETLTQSQQLSSKVILVCKQGGLGALFSCSDMLGGLTSFTNKEKRKHIHHFYLNTCLNLALFLLCSSTRERFDVFDFVTSFLLSLNYWRLSTAGVFIHPFSQQY